MSSLLLQDAGRPEPVRVFRQRTKARASEISTGPAGASQIRPELKGWDASPASQFPGDFVLAVYVSPLRPQELGLLVPSLTEFRVPG